MHYDISEFAHEKVNKHILISGCARSGTTIVGKLLHTFENVELNYEPPMMNALFPLINEIPEQHWKLMYEIYLYEDFFIDAICGRRINTNLGDDSSVWNVKSKAEIEARLAESVRKSDSEKMGEKSHIAYKLPDITPFLPKLKQYYPESRIVIVRRDAVGTLSSMIEKSWFSDANANANLIWPFVQYEGLKIPYWVSQDDLDKWLAMSELERCAYYYVLVNKAADDVPGHIELKYSDLLQDANGTAKQLAEQLGVSFGCRSQEVIGTIRPTEKTRDKNLFEKLTNKELKEQVEYYSVRSE